jgi:hypothetical protein
MTNAVQLSDGAQLLSGPQPACEGTGGFPSGVGTILLALLPQQKPYSVGGSPMQANFGIGTFALPGIGAGGLVTQAHTFYLRTATPITLEVTYGAGSPQAMKTSGLILIEADLANPITAVSVVTTLANTLVEYAAWGNA